MSTAENEAPEIGEPEKKKLKVDEANGSDGKNGSASAEASEDSSDSTASEASANGSAVPSEDGDVAGKTGDEKKKFVRLSSF